ncbi:hypothetical protein SAM23877_1289 [Streptomyces ambofaciens ATCC 23877]|uniref:Uncharacterized protein n=1 Tax=Streptomyces ambofaciens (strain ATCC 23877 / 3486 / DSM 40053 / JCM 4204 / NBRC 12836 / NRRL B-2516) TaxID=278992 RepID=A0A0K2AMW2_STRA7|nr:hypothetical protein SAM23877_1289 [Streptomyces ambofaciens ATCC 23877]
MTPAQTNTHGTPDIEREGDGFRGVDFSYPPVTDSCYRK